MSVILGNKRIEKNYAMILEQATHYIYICIFYLHPAPPNKSSFGSWNLLSFDVDEDDAVNCLYITLDMLNM